MKCSYQGLVASITMLIVVTKLSLVTPTACDNYYNCGECNSMYDDDENSCGWCSDYYGYVSCIPYHNCTYGVQTCDDDDTSASTTNTNTNNNCTTDYDVSEFDCADTTKAQQLYMEFQTSKYGVCTHESRVAFIWVPCLFFFFMYLLRLRYIYICFPEMYEDFDLYSHLINNVRNGLGVNKKKNNVVSSTTLSPPEVLITNEKIQTEEEVIVETNEKIETEEEVIVETNEKIETEEKVIIKTEEKINNPIIEKSSSSSSIISPTSKSGPPRLSSSSSSSGMKSEISLRKKEKKSEWSELKEKRVRDLLYGNKLYYGPENPDLESNCGKSSVLNENVEKTEGYTLLGGFVKIEKYMPQDYWYYLKNQNSILSLVLADPDNPITCFTKILQTISQLAITFFIHCLTVYMQLQMTENQVNNNDDENNTNNDDDYDDDEAVTQGAQEILSGFITYVIAPIISYIWAILLYYFLVCPCLQHKTKHTNVFAFLQAVGKLIGLITFLLSLFWIVLGYFIADSAAGGDYIICSICYSMFSTFFTSAGSEIVKSLFCQFNFFFPPCELYFCCKLLAFFNQWAYQRNLQQWQKKFGLSEKAKPQEEIFFDLCSLIRVKGFNFEMPPNEIEIIKISPNTSVPPPIQGPNPMVVNNPVVMQLAPAVMNPPNLIQGPIVMQQQQQQQQQQSIHGPIVMQQQQQSIHGPIVIQQQQPQQQWIQGPIVMQQQQQPFQNQSVIVVTSPQAKKGRAKNHM